MIVKQPLANGRLTDGTPTSPTDSDKPSLDCRPTQPWAGVVLSGAATVDQLASNLRPSKLTQASYPLWPRILSDTGSEGEASAGRSCRNYFHCARPPIRIYEVPVGWHNREEVGATMQTEISRRGFLYDLGKGTLALAVLGLAACTEAGDSSGSGSTSAEPEATTTPRPQTGRSNPPSNAGSAWERVNFGFVSAYIVVRDGEAAVVDTGVEDGEAAIEAGLTSLGVDWTAVGHVIITHRHGDHQGSLPAVLGLAADATGYAGAGDLAAITSPRPLVSVGDGDTVFDLEIIETPGHTPGHICVLSADAGLLIAGDALNGDGAGVIGANPQFTSDMAVANLSVKKLAGYQFDTVVFGHGEPVEGGASALVAELAASL